MSSFHEVDDLFVRKVIGLGDAHLLKSRNHSNIDSALRPTINVIYLTIYSGHEFWLDETKYFGILVFLTEWIMWMETIVLL